MQEGYDVSALQFILKPIQKDKLFSALNRAEERLVKLRKTLIIDTEAGNRKILLNDIFFLEAFGHTTAVNTENKQYIVPQSIGSIEKLLDDSFVRCHRSYIAGIRHIRRIFKTEIELENGKSINLSRRLYKNVNQAFIKYYKREAL